MVNNVIFFAVLPYISDPSHGLNIQVSEIDPDVDRVILIHVLSAEALDLAKVSDTAK